MQTEEELALLLIKNILPPVLDSIAKLSSWRSNTYARKYFVSPSERYRIEVMTKFHTQKLSKSHYR